MTASPSPRTLLALEVPVMVEIGRVRVALQDVLEWKPGTMIELPKAADEELELRINGLQVAEGTAVKVGETFGVRVQRTTLPGFPGGPDEGEGGGEGRGDAGAAA
ncbi:FliM/FliN family flagellar motor switch protein [Phycisphaera mikurensis]|uniref:Flagellar motor switch protein FliN n=1 Tax=Phycisphaera mikurensis (strain NBRC 102666 / KCTC 22515 / FYK2301M01) TaxID=1142394 RepID=I0IB04_PHYMF|nr:FliM/FliN family flagellar motor switch protein [Phycisphaera mikurensis]MBB6442586.1 flagellar motor switch protein FliN/FliY [Phycisphaera mikurensis]BAM02442.1 putative flagellar motor switch protein FliN [Phycisphaera mikurensis NBRC 102666]